MIVTLHPQRLQTLDEVRTFLAGSVPLDFKVPDRDDAFEWIQNTLRQFGYKCLGNAEKDLVGDYLIKVPMQCSDNEAARRLNKARDELFRDIIDLENRLP